MVKQIVDSCAAEDAEQSDEREANDAPQPIIQRCNDDNFKGNLWLLKGSRNLGNVLREIGEATFISIMLASTRALEERQLEAYGTSPQYALYREGTPRLFVSGGAASRALLRWVFPDGWSAPPAPPEAVS